MSHLTLWMSGDDQTCAPWYSSPFLFLQLKMGYLWPNKKDMHSVFLSFFFYIILIQRCQTYWGKNWSLDYQAQTYKKSCIKIPSNGNHSLCLHFSCWKHPLEFRVQVPHLNPQSGLCGYEIQTSKLKSHCICIDGTFANCMFSACTTKKQAWREGSRVIVLKPKTNVTN